MLEVEKKFSLTKDEEQRLLAGAEFVSEKTFTDTYLDDRGYSLTSADKWLRERDGKFEFKVPFTDQKSVNQRVMDQYRELENDEEIYQVLNLQKTSDLKNDLQTAGYLPFASIVTTRKKFRRADFVIDMDEMDFGYTIAEIEKLVEDEDQAKVALESILQFAKQNNITIKPVRGKVIEYLQRNKPDHFKALVEAGVVNEKIVL